MANDVKWIKLMVGMFDGMSFKKIKRAKIGGESYRDKLTAVWFELMDFAGKCNHDGMFISPREIPFTDLADIAMMIDRDEEELKLCMAFFINEGMVSVIDDVYMLSNWSEYQNVEGLDKIREQNRLRQKKWYDKQKALPNVIPNVSMTQPNDTDKEEEKEIKNKNKETKSKKKEVKSYSEDVELNNAILSFIEYRKSVKKPMTDRAVELLITKLNGMTGDIQEQIEILNQSIVNGWQGIFPLKEQDKRTAIRREPVQKDDDLALLRKQLGMKTAGNDEGVRQRAEALKREIANG